MAANEPGIRAGRYRPINISENERLISGLGGAALALYGLRRSGLKGLLLAIVGGGLIYRGATGHSDFYAALGVSASKRKGRRASVKHGAGIKVEKSVTINKSAEEMFRFWRNFENLPSFMNHLESVRVIDPNRSHWSLAAAGMTIEWDAEIFDLFHRQCEVWNLQRHNVSPQKVIGFMLIAEALSGQTRYAGFRSGCIE